MARLVPAVILLLLMTGCAKPTYWYRVSGASREEAAKDQYECTQESRTSWSGGGSGRLGLTMAAVAASSAEQQAKRLYAMCMQARGWEVTDDLAHARSQHGSQPK